MTAKNYLIKVPSGLMLRYIDTKIIATIKGMILIIARSIFYVLKAYDVQIAHDSILNSK